MRTSVTVLFFVLLACGCGPATTDPPDQVEPDGGECAGMPNGSSCDGGSGLGVLGSCNAGSCEAYVDCAVLQENAVCGGDPTDPVHGRCTAGVCAWQDYQCVQRADGAACVRGDSGGTCQKEQCCSWCVDASGACIAGGPKGGVPCP
jgi:hypothetical protein